MPKFFQKLPRKKSQQFLLKNNVFRLAQKVTTMHLGFSLRKFVTEKFQKSPNLVTLNCSPTLTQICALTPSISLSLSLSLTYRHSHKRSCSYVELSPSLTFSVTRALDQ